MSTVDFEPQQNSYTQDIVRNALEEGFKVGDRVIVNAEYSIFDAMQGVITAVGDPEEVFEYSVDLEGASKVYSFELDELGHL